MPSELLNSAALHFGRYWHVSSGGQVANPVAMGVIADMTRMKTPDAAPDSCRAMPTMAMLVSGVRTTAWPTERTIFRIHN
jgi:hypothetical protein